MERILHVLWIIFIYSKIVVINSSPDIQISNLAEFCLSETFKPTCGADEVVVITSALYGRMKIGKCVDFDFGFVGCSVDVLDIADSVCSGKASCEISIPHTAMNEALKCLTRRGLSPYLEVAFSCQKGVQPRSRKCISPEKIFAEKYVKQVASVTSKESLCGLHQTPWIIEAQSGQVIHLNIVDFAWKKKDDDSQRADSCAISYGYILDMESDDVISICGGGLERERFLYTSVGSHVQVILEKSATEQYHFLLNFRATGCPDYIAPKYSWMQRENDTIIIGCGSDTTTWRLKCIDNIWLGMVGECPPSPGPKVNIEKENIPILKDEIKSEKKTTGLLYISNNHVIVFTIGCFTILICCFIVLLGIYCTKRYEVKVQKYSTSLGSRERQLCSAPSTIYRPVCKTAFPINTLIAQGYTLPDCVHNHSRGPEVTANNTTLNTNRSDENLQYENMDEGEESVHYYVLENAADMSVKSEEKVSFNSSGGEERSLLP